MRASRAYIAGAGTTGVLIASAVLLLAVVSALVAFRGGPGDGIGEDIGSLIVDEPKRLAVEGPPQVALNASAAAAAVAASPTPGTAAAGTRAVRTATDFQVAARQRGIDLGPAPPPPDPPEFTSGQRDNSAGQAPVSEPPPGGLLPQTPISPQVNRLTDTLGNTTQGLTDNLGGTVGQVNPQLGQTVTDTGRMLAELLRGLGRPQR